MNLALLLNLITAAAGVLPEISSILPIVEKLISGDTASDADVAAINNAVAALEKIVASKEAALEG